MVEPEKQPPKLPCHLPRSLLVDHPFVVAKLPFPNMVGGIIKRRDRERIDQQGYRRCDGDIGPSWDREKRCDEGVHEWNDHSDTQPERDRPWNRTTVEPPKGGITKRSCKGSQKAVALYRLLGGDVALQPLRHAEGRSHLSHGPVAVFAAPASSPAL